jgi:hypothetical protein
MNQRDRLRHRPAPASRQILTRQRPFLMYPPRDATIVADTGVI